MHRQPGRPRRRGGAGAVTTITPTEEATRLWIKERSDVDHMRDIMTRWLERAAARKGRHINEPSVRLYVDRHAEWYETYLYASADSFPDTLPDWLRTTPIRGAGLVAL